MNQSDIVNYCIEQLKQAGAHKSQCAVTFSEKKELNVETGEMSLSEPPLIPMLACQLL